MRKKSWLALAAAATWFFPRPARAHCPISYAITGPGGLAWQIDLDGDLYDGMLPGGTMAQPGPMTSWTDTRRIGVTLGTVPIALTVTDGTHVAVCPPVALNLSGPPRCSEDYDAPGEVPHPLCVPYFTVTRTAPGVFSCSSTCQPITAYPAPQAYAPPPTVPPTLSALSPTSAKAGGAPLALSVSGAGFAGGAVVQWNGSPLSTYFLSGGSVAALVPAALLASPGTATVTVANPGSVSASMTFTVSP